MQSTRKLNFNIRKKPEYNLEHRHTDELIRLYGVNCNLIIVQRINEDDLVFGDYSHLKTNSETYELFGLPETSEQWENVGINFSDFGMLNIESINLYFSRRSIDEIFDNIDANKGFSDIIGNLIVLPNSRIVEITHIEFEVPGVNNLFTENNTKNVYKFSCKIHDNKLVNEVQTESGSEMPGDSQSAYTELDTYFEELKDVKHDQDYDAEVQPRLNTEKPVLNTDEDSVFGRF